ncbi:hypothetical protein CBR_g54888 [Chara braunii]|uniref:Proteasome alpha-type subunits domain-containing protein n=1 Tax=Chara braunii TaxID=69332 RepID=A0A388JPS0_CHABU|nr:hypothetical protein CBR_g54888 [Chara braunii]|eukprot:GBG59785.1 hypothetical protein CBR_g54888 [Chara braunii]
MFRNQYDTDVTTWSPAGRLHQIEYAMEAVKQGSASVGLRSDTHVVLATLKRAASELSSYQRKIFKIDDHLGIAISGLNADGRVLSRYMRSECINHSFVYESPMPVGRLVCQVADKSQVCTQRSWKRPYGVGLLVAGYDSTGPHLYQTCPSGNYFEYRAMAIGSRSQAAKTYLERKFDSFQSCTLKELIRHALLAVKESIQDGELTSKNCSVAVVGRAPGGGGKGGGEIDKFTILEDADIQPYIDMLDAEELPTAVQDEDDEEKKDAPAEPEQQHQTQDGEAAGGSGDGGQEEEGGGEAIPMET